ncbi:TrbC/VirB2 family protein [Sphingobium yanoikuyae]|uniref:TrbC/VirB2 family protein n=1 Tax=Sphingobium yanoikuyae TaxID=13690 RepID=UPI000846FFDE|nr:TrbC/VirB2 family protein [Sphingobium yanoikuyae]
MSLAFSARPSHRVVVRSLGALALAALIGMAFADPAYAQSANGITSMAQNILSWLTGGFAKTIAVIAIAIVGYRFLTGHVSLQSLIIVIIGIFIVFSAQWIVDTISGG